MRNLSDTNELHNFQVMITFCDIFESRALLMHKKYDFNSRRYNLASTLRSCIQITLSKVIIGLPTDDETVELFEKSLLGGFSCINNPFTFDINILMSNVKNYSVASKIFKTDENNQYDEAITEPLTKDGMKNNKLFLIGVNLI